MTSNYLIQLFDYDSEVNLNVLKRLKEQASIPERTQEVFTHLLMTKKVWLMRIRKQDWSHLSIWPDMALNECETLIEENRDAYRNFLGSQSEAALQKSLRYKNSKGILYENTIRDILMHLLIHGGYHRGQIAMAIREIGGEPVNTDYIMHIREPISD